MRASQANITLPNSFSSACSLSFLDWGMRAFFPLKVIWWVIKVKKAWIDEGINEWRKEDEGMEKMKYQRIYGTNTHPVTSSTSIAIDCREAIWLFLSLTADYFTTPKDEVRYISIYLSRAIYLSGASSVFIRQLLNKKLTLLKGVTALLHTVHMKRGVF
jgi:hypothetical protein